MSTYRWALEDEDENTLKEFVFKAQCLDTALQRAFAALPKDYVRRSVEWSQKDDVTVQGMFVNGSGAKRYFTLGQVWDYAPRGEGK